MEMPSGPIKGKFLSDFVAQISNLTHWSQNTAPQIPHTKGDIEKALTAPSQQAMSTKLLLHVKEGLALIRPEIDETGLSWDRLHAIIGQVTDGKGFTANEREGIESAAYEIRYAFSRSLVLQYGGKDMQEGMKNTRNRELLEVARDFPVLSKGFGQLYLLRLQQSNARADKTPLPSDTFVNAELGFLKGEFRKAVVAEAGSSLGTKGKPGFQRKIDAAVVARLDEIADEYGLPRDTSHLQKS